MFDFVTVFFSGDAVLLKLQARSIRLFVEPSLVGKIFVINNDESPHSERSYFDNEVMPEYGKFASRVSYVGWDEVIANKYTATGWRVQQALKLAISKMVSSRYYVTLDAKNHYIRPIGYSDCFEVDGGKEKPTMFRASPTGNLKDYFQKTMEYLGQDAESLMHRSMPATTPYTLYSSIVRDLVAYLEEREGCSLEEFMLKRNRHVTEFYLYFAFLLRSGFHPDDLYKFRKKSTVTLFTRWPEREEDVNRALGLLSSPEYKGFGLHRNRVARMSPSQRSLIIQAWQSSGLVVDPAEAAHFLGGAQ